MKRLIKSSLILIIAFLFCCEDETIDSDYSLKLFLERSGFAKSETFINGGDYEFGIRFKPKVDGDLSAFIVRIPENRNDLRVTLWDAYSKVALADELLSSVEANVQLIYPIDPFPLVKGTEYMITVNNNDWYSRTRPDNTDVTYPITFEDIIITGYGQISGTEQAYPTEFVTSYYAGDLSFIFK